MTEEGIYLFLNALDVDTSKIRKSKATRGEWLSLVCPLAFHTHHDGIDTRPSFFVSINEEGHSFYNCFGCSEKAKRLISLLHNIWLMSGEYPHKAAKIYTQYELHDSDINAELTEYCDIWDTFEQRKIDPLPQKVLSKYQLLYDNVNVCTKYLKKRGVSSDIWEKCKVRRDGVNNTLIFPFTNILGEIYVLRVRTIINKKIWTVSTSVKEFSDIIFPTIREVGVFFGMELVDFSKPVVIVEAPIDAMRLMSLGLYNVVASGTSMITSEQVRAVCADSIVLGFDMDLAGQKARKRVLKYIGEDIVVSDLDWGIVDKKNAEPCKDGADLICKEDLIKVLKNKITY